MRVTNHFQVTGLAGHASDLSKWSAGAAGQTIPAGCWFSISSKLRTDTHVNPAR